MWFSPRVYNEIVPGAVESIATDCVGYVIVYRGIGDNSAALYLGWGQARDRLESSLRNAVVLANGPTHFVVVRGLREVCQEETFIAELGPLVVDLR